eukprot:augustus_masked-scaffold_7-processed-gene-9.56-mRNA-1 protein AED:0.41 eAED:0.41 QI:0/-1/0/1/-1/1/1/0/1148
MSNHRKKLSLFFSPSLAHESKTSPSSTMQVYPLDTSEVRLLSVTMSDSAVPETVQIKDAPPLVISRCVITEPKSSKPYVFSLTNNGELYLGKDIFAPLRNFNFVQIASGKSFAAFLADNGKVFTVGSNKYGQLSHNYSQGSFDLRAFTVQKKNGAAEVFVEISASGSSLYALSRYGRVYVSGLNNKGQLGTGKKRNESFLTKVQGVLRGNAVVHISSDKQTGTESKHFGLAVNKFGDIYAYGELSDKYVTHTPVKIVHRKGIKFVSVEGNKLGFFAISKDRKELHHLSLDKAVLQDNALIARTKKVFESDDIIVDLQVNKRCGMFLTSSGTAFMVSKHNGNIQVQKVGEQGIFKITGGSMDNSFYCSQIQDAEDIGRQLIDRVPQIDILLNELSLGTSRDFPSESLPRKWRNALCTVENFNASFVRDGAFDFEFLAQSSQGLIDVLKKESSNKQVKKQQMYLRQLISTLVANVDMATVLLGEDPDPVQLRSYFLLLVSDLLIKTSPNEFEIILVSFMRLSTNGRKVLFNWVASLRDDQLKQLVQNVVSLVNVHVKHKKYSKGNVVMCQTLHILNSIAHSKQSKLFVDENVDRWFNISLPASSVSAEGEAFVSHHLRALYNQWKSLMGTQMVERDPRGGEMDLLARVLGLTPRRRIRSPTVEEPVTPASDYGVLEGETVGLIEKYSYTRFERVLANNPEFFYFVFPFLLPADLKRSFMQQEDRERQEQSFQSSVTEAINANGGIIGLLTGRAPTNFNLALVMEIGRESVLEDTMKTIEEILLKDNKGLSFRKPLKVKFKGEQGLDAGGVRKEFFLLLGNKLFDPSYGIFVEIPQTGQLWFSGALPFGDDLLPDGEFVQYKDYMAMTKQYPTTYKDELKTLKIIGIILGLAIYNDTLLDLQFPKAFYEILLAQFDADNLNLRTFSHFNPSQAQSLDYILKIEDPEELDSLELAFEVTDSNMGVIRDVELVENGRNIPVTLENRDEYIKAMIKYYMYSDLIRAKAAALLDGFSKVIPSGQAAFHLFNADELERLLTGTTELDMNLLKNNAEYEGGYKADTKTIKSLWKIVLDFNEKEKQLFLRFCTGSSRAPVGGLKNVKFKVQRAGPDSKHLPTAYTCFNTLMLPDYSSAKKMKKLLLLAIENSEGFGLE